MKTRPPGAVYVQVQRERERVPLCVCLECLGGTSTAPVSDRRLPFVCRAPSGSHEKHLFHLFLCLSISTARPLSTDWNNGRPARSSSLSLSLSPVCGALCSLIVLLSLCYCCRCRGSFRWCCRCCCCCCPSLLDNSLRTARTINSYEPPEASHSQTVIQSLRLEAARSTWPPFGRRHAHARRLVPVRAALGAPLVPAASMDDAPVALRTAPLF